MKTKRAICLLITSLLALTGCDLFNMINNLFYDSFDDYIKKNDYQEISISSFNNLLKDHMYFWSKEIQTYTNTDDINTRYYSPQSDNILEFTDNNQTTIYSRYGERIVVMYGESNTTPVRYYFEDDPEVMVTNELKVQYVDENNMRQEMDDAHEYLFRCHVYEDGYLFVTQKNFMFYLSKDFKEYYINTNDTATFTNFDKQIEVPESALLTDALAALPEKEKLYFPIPENYEGSVYAKDNIDEEDGHYISYNVLIPNVKASEYVKLLQQNGLEVYRGECHPMFDIGADESGEWIVYDKNQEFATHLQFDTSYCAVKGSDEKNRGLELNIQKAESKFSYYGKTVNTQTDWTDDEKALMEQNYGFVLPFINLGRRYHVDKQKRAHGEHPMTTPLNFDAKCYWVFDNFYKDVITETYGTKLEAIGFNLYETPVTKESSVEEIRDWKNSEDCKYYEMYLNTDLDLGIKFYFDDIYGNTIKIFKLSEIHAWNYDAKN